MGLLDHKVAVITGGTRGLGLGIARAFIAEGAAVVVASRSVESVEKAVEGLIANGGRAAGMSVDVGNLAQVQALGQFVTQTFGRLDVWINNAGLAGTWGRTIDLAPDEFMKVVQTNILGVYNGSYTALHYFLAQKSGKLINMLGQGERQPSPFQNVYGSSKSWVRNFTQALAQETKDSGVGVFAFNPGLVVTELLTEVDAVEGAEFRKGAFQTVIRMWGNPPQVPARKLVWMASQATDGKTGLVVRQNTPFTLLGGALKEGFRRLSGRPLQVTEINIRRIPPVKP